MARKYTQDEINAMTAEQRSQAWHGADAESQAALHAANQKELSGANTYDANTGVWTPKTSQSVDWTAEWQKEMAGGADYSTLKDIYNNRLNKTMEQGWQQYAGDAVQQQMEAYLQANDPNSLKGMQEQISQIISQMQQPVYAYGGNDKYDIAERILSQLESNTYEDWTKGSQYEALADRYGHQGKLTMQDVLGQIGSRTGGLASSYATTAAQQQYNEYMAQLEEVARNQYGQERGELLENAQLAMEMGDSEYQRYLDQMSLQRQNQSAALSAIYEMLGYQSEEETAAKNLAQSRVQDYLVNQGGSLGQLDADLIRQSGYTTAELNAMAAQYQRAQEAAAAEAGTETPMYDLEGLFQAASASGLSPKTFLNQKVNYSAYGLDKAPDYDEYLAWAEDNAEPSAAGEPMNPSNFRASMQSIVMDLQSGNEDRAERGVRQIWERLDEGQRAEVQNALGQYGIEFYW